MSEPTFTGDQFALEEEYDRWLERKADNGG
jgi:hypothetical protein